MPTKRLSRRTMLRGVLATGASLALPLPVLDIMLNDNGTAFAQGMPLPRRYVTWFFGNGILPPIWNPVSTGADWALSEQLAPLADVKNWLTVVSGLQQPLATGSPHPTGSAVATTGADFKNNSAVLPSIDQIVASVNQGGRFPSLEVGVSNATPNGPENTLHAVSHRGPSAPNFPEFNPHALFTRIFTGSAIPATAGGDSMPEQMAKLSLAKRSILDAVLADGDELSDRLGAADQRRLSDHLEAIRGIEKRLQTLPPPIGMNSAIQIPGDPLQAGVTTDTKAEAPAAVNQVMAEMLAVALATDVTRSASMVFTLPAAHVFFRSLGSDMNDDFHDTICHTDAGDNAHQTRVHRGVVYTMQALAAFVGRLAAMPEGAGTILDNSLVYVTSCTSWGKIHDRTEWPALLVGKAGGALRGNQHYRAEGHALPEVLLTIANVFGANLATLGKDGSQVNNELSGLRIA